MASAVDKQWVVGHVGAFSVCVLVGLRSRTHPRFVALGWGVGRLHAVLVNIPPPPTTKASQEARAAFLPC
jgi:hypothetical protein